MFEFLAFVDMSEACVDASDTSKESSKTSWVPSPFSARRANQLGVATVSSPDPVIVVL